MHLTHLCLEFYCKYEKKPTTNLLIDEDQYQTDSSSAYTTELHCTNILY